MGALSRPADRDARQAHARPGGFSVPGRHGTPVPAHPHPNPAERRADGGAAEGEGSQRGADAGRGASWIQLRAARPALLGGPRIEVEGGVPASHAAGAVRPGVRQCGVDAPARRDDRRGPDAVRVPHHSPAAAGRGARLVPRRSRELAHRPARLPVPGQPREPATAQDRVRRARPGAPGGSADRLRPERQPDAGHL